MILAQFAVASRSSVEWLNNARRLLKRKVHTTPSGARWWGMVRMLNHEVGIPLLQAAKAADAVLGGPHTTHRVRIDATTDESVTLLFDLERFHSTANASLAAALAFVSRAPRGRPRRPSTQRVRHRAAPMSEIWTIRVDDSSAALERLAFHLREWGAYPRGIEAGLPFLMDAATLRAVPKLALTTKEKGPIDVFVEAAPKPVAEPARA